jgi:hypothetical protein
VKSAIYGIGRANWPILQGDRKVLFGVQYLEKGESYLNALNNFVFTTVAQCDSCEELYFTQNGAPQNSTSPDRCFGELAHLLSLQQ